MIRHYKTRITCTGHYYTYGELSNSTRYNWLALHGYGQLAERLLGKFSGLDAEKNFVAAPEGLSRFYWEGVQGDVVASWMTRKDRLDAIADYIEYLDKIYAILGFDNQSTAENVLLGFSQGCATGWRWLLNSHPSIHTYVMWSGWLPEDMDYQAHAEYLETVNIIYVHGEQDPFFVDGRYDVLLERFEEAGLNPLIMTHSGGHTLDRGVLSHVFKRIQS